MSTHKPMLTPAEVFRLLVEYRWRWLIPACAGAVLGLVYGLVAPDKWEAAQALMLRNEAFTNTDGLGKFRHADDMKATQETILEVAKSRQVLTEALVKTNGANAQPPNDEAIEELRKHIKVTPPKGAEFGKTEVFYLKVTDHSRERALQLVANICDALQARYQEVLNERATSMANELTNAVKLAQADLRQASNQLASMEAEVGNDLAELRILQSSPSGASDLRQRVVFIEGEIRRLQTQQRKNEELLSLLRSTSEDPSRLVAAPQSLLESQPALKRLKEGLVDAQLRTSQLRGNMTEEHPTVKAALAAEQQIRNEISNELKEAIAGAEADSRLNNGQIDLLKKQLDETDARLTKIAALRTQYGNLVAEVDSSTKLLQQAEANLADARAKEAGAQSASLINRIGKPDSGTRPVSPGLATLVAAGFAGGLMIGLGVVVLTVPLPAQASVQAPAQPQPKADSETVTTVPATPSAAPVATTTKAPQEAPAARARRVERTPGEKLNLKTALLQLGQGQN